MRIVRETVTECAIVIVLLHLMIYINQKGEKDKREIEKIRPGKENTDTCYFFRSLLYHFSVPFFEFITFLRIFNMSLVKNPDPGLNHLVLFSFDLKLSSSLSTSMTSSSNCFQK